MNSQGTGRAQSNLVPAKVAAQYCSVQPNDFDCGWPGPEEVKIDVHHVPSCMCHGQGPNVLNSEAVC